MPINPITIKLVVDVISAILPFGHIANAWANYLNYRAKKLEINYKIKELEAKVPLAKDYIRSKTKIELERLKNERNNFNRRIAIVEKQLVGITLNSNQISRAIDTLINKLSDARGDDLRYITQAISHLNSCLTQQDVSVFDLFKKEIDLQITSIDYSINNSSQIQSNTKFIEGS